IALDAANGRLPTSVVEVASDDEQLSGLDMTQRVATQDRSLGDALRIGLGAAAFASEVNAVKRHRPSGELKAYRDAFTNAGFVLRIVIVHLLKIAFDARDCRLAIAQRKLGEDGDVLVSGVVRARADCHVGVVN